MKLFFASILLAVTFLLGGCSEREEGIPLIGFVDAYEDSTLGLARDGFLDALDSAGFSEENGGIKVIYRNAQGNIPTLTQIVQYMIAQKVDILATCPSLATITALQATEEIPVCMMVSPEPSLMDLSDFDGRGPDNLFGVGEDLRYIDTAFGLIPELIAPKDGPIRVGLLYNQSEPQSVDAYQRLKFLADSLKLELIARPVNATADAQLVTGALLNEGIDVFFANPDNTVFGAFETITKSCNAANVPIFTSESGLVARGAVVAFGADIYLWGYQAGKQAAEYLRNPVKENLKWEMVKVRNRVYNAEVAKKFNLAIPSGFERVR